MPEMKVNSVIVPPGNSFKMTPLTNNNGVIDFRFSIDMILNITVTNYNRYHLKVENINLNVF